MKFLKKHFAKFIMAFTLVFTSLFVAFGCNTYAFTFDNNGNIVTDNLMDCDNYNYVDAPSNNTWQILGVSYIDNYTNQYTISFNYNQSISGNGGLFLIQSNTPTAPSEDYPDLGDKLLRTYEYGYADNILVQVVQTLQSNEISMPYVMLGFRSRNYKTFNLNKVMFNIGNSALSWEPYGTWYSQENYDSIVTQNHNLQNAYDSLSQDYFNLKSLYNYGFFSSLESLRFTAYNSGNIVINDTFSLQDLINAHYFSDGTFLLDNFIMSYNSNTYDNAFVKFSFDPYLIASNVDIIFVGSYAFNFQFEIDFSSGELVTYNITNQENVIYSNKLNNYSVIFGNATITSFKFSYAHDDFIPNINFNSTYSNAYNTGFSAGLNSSSSTIQELENNISDLNSQVANMANTINTLQVAYNDLNTSYENMLNGNNFANLFFTIAETPFASFKQIWNVDFLGVNLAGFVTGILFLGLIIWVIKKIF